MGIALSLIFFYLIFQKVDISKVFGILGEVNYFLVLLAIPIHLSSFIFRSVRWSVILQTLKKFEPIKLFPFISIGYMANNVLPFRLGELIRAQFFGKKIGLSRSSVLATILVERLLDGWTLLSFLGLILIFYPLPANFAKLPQIGFIIFLFPVLFFLLFVRFGGQKLLSSLAQKNTGRKYVGSGLVFFNNFFNGLEILKKGRNTTTAFGYSICVWLLETSLLYIISLAFNLNLAFWQFLLIMSIVGIGMLIPSAPGYFGPFEFFVVSMLVFFGIEKNTAVSYAFLTHFVGWLPINLIGFFFAFKLGFTLKTNQISAEVKDE